MDSISPIQRATTGIGKHFEVPNSCKSILQMVVVKIIESKAIDAFKIKLYDNGDKIITKAYIE